MSIDSDTETNPDTGEEWSLKRLLSEVVGSGPNSADDMTREQARDAFARILAGEPAPATLGAFLLANRWKRNRPEELASFVDVMRERSVTRAIPDADPVDCGANYDGKRETALLGVGAGVVAAAAGTPVVVHSSDRVPATRGDVYKHVLDELGVETDLEPEESAAMVDETGFGFYYQPRFNPRIHALLERREDVSVRTAINTIETLANPADADVHIGSFFHLTFAKKVVNTLVESETQDLDRVIMFQGLEGYDDVRPGRAKVAEWNDGTLDDYEIETGALGVGVESGDLGVENVAVDSARITREVLDGDRYDRFTDTIALNAAVRLYAGDQVADVEEGYELAHKTITDGDAATVLCELRAFNPP